MSEQGTTQGSRADVPEGLDLDRIRAAQLAAKEAAEKEEAGNGSGPAVATAQEDAGLPEDAPEGLARAALGKDVTDEEEVDGLKWLLGQTRRAAETVEVKIGTPHGLRPVWFHIRAVSDDRENALDDEHRAGDGPFARLDVPGFNAALVAEATEWIAGADGRRVMVDSPEFVGGMPGGPAAAMRARFKYEPGVLEELAGAIRRLAGRTGDRVGKARRAMVSAAGNS